jgi:hypothetical protein
VNAIVRPSGVGLVYSYNARGRLVGIQNASGSWPTLWASIAADAAGRIVAETTDNGAVTTTRFYDPNRAWLTGVAGTYGASGCRV